MQFLNIRMKVNLLAKLWQTKQVLFSTQRKLSVELLKKRTVLKLYGADTTNFLQSMVTNDVKNITGLPTLYSLLLNPNGRVLYDTILYKISDDEYLVEYDSTAVEYLHKHLMMYRLRKNVKMEPLTGMAVWVLYNQFEDGTCLHESNFQTINDHLNKVDGIVKHTQDPRNASLGIRVITEKDLDLQKSLTELGVGVTENDNYELLRYKLGIGEGVKDHPPGSCLPFETNVDLLNGVSFTKGCYIGQEMTAKSNFVLVIRKRLVPVIFDKMDSYPIFPPECGIVNDKQQKMGRLRSHLGEYGLALLKYEDCVKSKSLKLQGFDINLKLVWPKWWPSNLSSDKNEQTF